ncbi:F-box protein [Arabidopsis thaliana]
MAMSNLPRDLLEEVLSRVPVKSIAAVRSTCKNWNSLTYGQSFTKKLYGKTMATKEKEFLVVMTMDLEVYLMRVNLHGIHKDDNNVKSSIMQKAKLIRLNDDRVRVDDICKVFHCDGLLLCITIGIRLVVCNPYCGQTRCIKTRRDYHITDNYALGHEKMKNSPLRNYKILVLYFTCDWKLPFSQLGVSLKGNTYWFAREMYIHGPRIDLHLPFHSRCVDTVTLASVREEQLAVLFQDSKTLILEVWITTKIEPNAVSWSSKVFLEVNMSPLTGFQFNRSFGSFFIVEEKNVVVVPIKGGHFKRNLAYIIGKDEYFKEVDLGVPSSYIYFSPHVCSYVPSLVQIKKDAQVMLQHHNVSAEKHHEFCASL